MDAKHTGALSETLAIVWLLRQGFEVFQNVSAHGPADLVGWIPGGVPNLYDVKTLSMSPGSSGRRYASITNPTPRHLECGVQLIYVHALTGTVSLDPLAVAEAAGDLDIRSRIRRR